MKKLIAALALLLAGCSAPVPKHTAARPPPLPPAPPAAANAAVKSSNARTKSLKIASFTAPESVDPCAPRAGRGHGSIRLEWPCLTNASFMIETSLNLLEWKIIGTSINSAPEYPLTNSVLIVIESDPRYTYRFYRVVPIADNGDRL